MAIVVFGQITSQTLLVPSATATTDHVEGIWIEKKELKNCLGAVVATCKHTAAETTTSEVSHPNSTHQHFILQHKAKPTVSALDSGKTTWTKQASFGQYFTHLLLPNQQWVLYPLANGSIFNCPSKWEKMYTGRLGMTF